MSAVTIAPATEAETPACLALLPSLAQRSAEFVVARRGPELLGAAGVVWRNRREGPGFPLALEVVPAARRQGIGRGLVEAARRRILGEAAGLWSLDELEEDGPAAAFALACGFSAARRRHHFIADVGPLQAYLDKLLVRLRSRAGIPDDARVVPLAQAPLAEAGWLVSAEFGGGPERARELLTHGGLLASSISLAVMQGERLAGVILGRWEEGGVAKIEAEVTAPGWRGAWVTPVMLEAIVKIGRAEGGQKFRFHCGEEVQATMRLAVRSQAVRERTASLYFQAAS